MRGEFRNTFSCLFLILLVAIPQVSFADFSPFKDITSSYDASFRKEVNAGKDSQYIIGRVHIDDPYYDGSPGYNVIFIRKSQKPNLRGPKDILTQLIKKQLRLFGFSSSTQSLYTFHMGQHGAEFRIKRIIVNSPKHTDGQIVGPSGGFQYGSPSPDGAYCILVDSRVIAVNLATSKWHEIEIPKELSNIEADPFRQSKNGTSIGGSANLSSEYMEMVWNSSRSGKLVIKDSSKRTIREVLVNIK